MCSMTSRESLVDLIFTKCSLVYGREFLSRWEGLNMDEVKEDWQRELGGLLNSPAAVLHGLERLPAEKPPTVLQFRALCIGAPGDRHAPVPALPAPPADPASKERIKSLLEQARERITRKAEA